MSSPPRALEAEEQNRLAQRLKSLHRPGEPVVMANVYDAATAAIVSAHPRCEAVATASYAIAASTGVEGGDDAMSRAENLAAIAYIAPPVVAAGKPLSTDLQDGYDDPAETVRQAIRLGSVGCNLEDVAEEGTRLRSLDDAVARIRAALDGARSMGVPDYVVNARTDCLDPRFGAGSIDDAIARGRAFLAAGATTVFVWGGPSGRGLRDDEIARLVAALGGMVNVKLKFGPGFLTVKHLAEMGVARISVGPELFRAAMATFRDEAGKLLEWR